MTNEELSLYLLERLSMNATIQDIINEATDILDNSIMIVDARFRIVYSTNHVDVNIKAWNLAIEHGYISDKMLQVMEREDMINELRISQKSVRTVFPSGYSGLRVGLFHENCFYGFIGMYNYFSNELKNEQLYIVSNVIKIFFFLMNMMIIFMNLIFINYCKVNQKKKRN